MCETEIERTEEDAYETDTISLSLGRYVIKTAALLVMKDIISRKSVICLDQGPWGILLFHFLH